MKKKTLFTSLFVALLALPTAAQKKYKNPVYGSDFPDPTVQRALDGTFYAYATGCKCKKSTDLVSWTNVSGVISRPTWNDSIHADGTKDNYSLWAADVNYVDGKYVCYYASALWGNGSRTGIGVAVGDSPSKFTDKGKLFRSTEIGVKNSIDPCYVEEFDKKYIVWGSFNDICIAELTDDALSVKDFSPINNPQPNGSWKRHKGVTKIAGGAFEGAMIYKRGKYYYLFASVGSCCEGANSTYRTVVGRATKLTGPYVNKQGGQMVSNNYTTIISGNARWRGPGHNSEIITDDEGQDWLLYHSYDTLNNCNGRLMLLDKITWDRNDWPVVNDGHPSSDEMDAPIFYTGNGANVTYKVANADLSKSQWKGWDVVASEDCDNASGKGSAFMPVGIIQNGGTFDISQTIRESVKDGLYELRVNGFDTEHSVEYYVGKVATPVLCPADNGASAPTTAAVISNNFLNGKFSQSIYGLAVGSKLSFGMRTKQPLSASERFAVGNVRLIYRDNMANADSTALASVLNSYYAMAESYAAGDAPYYNGFDQAIAAYKEAAEGTEESVPDAKTRYQQLLKIHRTIDSIQTSIDAYAELVVAVKDMQEKLAIAEAGGYGSENAREVLAEGLQVLADRNLKDRELKALIDRLKAAMRDMMYSYQTGDGTQANPYVILRPEQLDHMHDVLIKDSMIWFVLGADVDMEGYAWKQLNTSENSYRYWINFDGQGHIIRNLTPVGTQYYPSFFGTMCGEIRNTGFVDAKVDATASGAAVIGGTLGHSTFKDAEENLFPVIIENCYVTGSITSKGYVGAIGGTLGNSPIIIRNCYSAASVTGNGSAANYSGGLVGRVRTNLTMENCYAAAPVSSPVAGGIVAGGQNRTTPASTYTNVIAWNPSVDGETAHPFGATIELDVLSQVYTFADLLLNGESTEEGKTHSELCQIAGTWGAPWHRNPTAGNGYPILQWQFDRGDYRDICGFDPDNDPTDIKDLNDSKDLKDLKVYNLAGQRLQKPQRGINIVGGKKIIVK